MNSSIIRNTDDLLSEIINKVLPSTNNLDILVGFFYFSGFKGIYKELKDKKVRILIGMNAELSIEKSVMSVSEKEFKVSTKSDYIKQIKDIFNKTDYIDNEEGEEAVNLYIEKIINGSLEIRKTLYPNHQKLYLFGHSDIASQGGTLPGTVISGSSNLTFSGLSGRRERNTIDRSPEVYLEEKDIFEDIWNNESTPITNGGQEDELVKVLKQETWLKLTKPYYCYLRILSEYFKDIEGVKTPKDLTGQKFENLEYQVDAIKKGLKIIEEHNGVIIADVVGLGKSVIGSSLIGNLQEKAIIICPPHLIDGWNDYKKDFGLNAEIFSSGSIDKALDYDITDIHKAGVVLIDEAHKYRNADTNDYGRLHQLCQGKKTILLTATPFNNEPNDIFNLIKLFQIPANPTIHTKNGLLSDFKELQNKYLEIRKEQREKVIDEQTSHQKLKKLSGSIRQIIGPVVVRRSRVDLEEVESYKKDLAKQGYEFAKVSDPRELKFDLGDLEKLYIDTLESLVEVDEKGNASYFNGARYKVLTYIEKNKVENYEGDLEDTLGYEYSLLEGRQKNMPFFIRRLLVARFESSIFSFKKTLNKIIESIENVENYLKVLDGVPVIKKGSLPDLEDIFNEDGEISEEKIDTIKEYLVNKEAILIKKEDLKPSFITDLENDKNFLKSMLKDWEKITSDPKLDNFSKTLDNIRKENPDRKIVVFSMFADTINYLQEKLGDRVLVVTGKSKTDTLKKDIKLNFDAGIDKKDRKNDFDILLGTDAISEGYNLHRAGVIINYDIPYNPTKVIQRIGRINRINKKVFDTLYVYNYFPSIVGEEYVSTKKISTLKIRMIATVLGVDVKTLSEDEEVGSFYKKVIEEDKNINESESWDTKYLNDFKNAQEEDKDILTKIENIPLRTRILRVENKGVSGVLLFAKKRSNLIFYFYDNNENKVIPLNIEEAFELFKASKDENPEEVSKDFHKKYKKLKEEIKKPNTSKHHNTQEQKALSNINSIFELTNDNYYKLLKQVIELGSLPKIYMKMLRKITQKDWQNQVKEIREYISEDYLKMMIETSSNFSEEMLDLIISEEF